MASDRSLDELWNSVPPSQLIFQPGHLPGLPEAARRYLAHAITPGTPLASAVRLRMLGEIKLGRWLPFTAEQVIHCGRGMIWRATVRMYGMPITGFDRLLDGAGEMRWKLLGIIPIMTASGPEITRSAAGRVMAESVWLPSALCRDEVAWTSKVAVRPEVRLAVGAETSEMALTVTTDGRLQNMQMQRWGNPGRPIPLRVLRRCCRARSQLWWLYHSDPAANRLVFRDQPV
jgi:hypothetical protein